MCLKRRAKSKVIDCQYNVDSLTSQSHSLCHFFSSNTLNIEKQTVC